MKRTIALAAILGLVLAVAVDATSVAPMRGSDAREPVCEARDADERERCAWLEWLLDLAMRSDRAYDTEPDWTTTREAWDGRTDDLIDLIVAQLVEEGVVPEATRPTSIGWVDYGPTRVGIAGQYNSESGAITLNHRFQVDPAYAKTSYLWTLVHELVHVNGFDDETATEALTFEMVAALANLDEPGFRGALLDHTRRASLLAAQWLAADEGRIVPSLHGSSICLPYEAACDPPEPRAELVDRVDTVRHEIFSSGELRRADKRLRRWDPGGRHRLLDIYTARPLSIALLASCAADGRAAGPFEYWSGATRRQSTPAFDDLAYVLDELGFDCRLAPPSP